MNILTKARVAGALAWSVVKATFTTTTMQLSDWWRGMAATWGSASYERLAQLMHGNAYASRGLRLIAQTAASVPFVVVTGEGTDARFDEQHEALRLLRRPNRRQTGRHFWDAVVNHLYAGGEIFIERRGPATGSNAGRARELHLHRPDRFVEFLYEPGSDVIAGYRMQTKGGQTKDFTLDEMLHVRTYHPTDEDRGLPIIIGAKRALELMQQGDDWNKSISAGGGRVPMYWVPEGLERGQQLTPDQVERAEDGLDARTKERRAANLGMVLSGSFKPVQGFVSPKEADWLQSSQLSARQVAAVLGVPATLIGDEKAGSLTDSGVDSEMKALYLLTVLPLIDFLFDWLNEWLQPELGGGRLTYDRDQIDALQEDMTEKYRRYREAAGVPIITPQEARQALGWDEVPSGTLHLPLGMEPVGSGRPGDAPQDAPPIRALASLDDVEELLGLIAA